MATSLQRFDPTSRQNRAALSMAMGAIVLLAYQNMPLARIVSNPGFYISWLASGLMTFAVIAVVRRVLAHIIAGGDIHEQRRFIGILLGAVLFPCLMALAMVYGLLESFGGGFAQSGYLNREFPLVVLFIVMLNLTYLTLHYRSELIRLLAELQKLMDSVQAKDIELATLQLRLDAAEVALVQTAQKPAPPRQVINDALSEKRKVRALPHNTGDTDVRAALLRNTVVVVDAFEDKPIALSRVAKVTWSKRAVWVTLDNNRQKKMRAVSLRKAMKALPPYWFVRISDTAIISRKFLVEDSVTPQDRKLLLTLILPNKVRFREVVARNAVPAFRAWLASGTPKQN